MIKSLFIFCVLTSAFHVFGQIRVTNPAHDLGEVYEHGGQVKTTFILQNPYRNDTIRIVNIETSCGCTAILTKDTLILPNSQIALDVAYDPSGRLGLFVKSIEITTRTGSVEQNKLFLKILGNVVAENFTAREVRTDLIEYQVAPIYFYPITPYDTSYFDFNYIGLFINDLTYEIDYYQFSTVGIAVELVDMKQLERVENLLTFVRNKIKREFKIRGFSENVIFFNEPIFTLNPDLPAWSAASIQLYSYNFNNDEGEETIIQVNSSEVIQKGKVLLDYQRFAEPKIEEILAAINFESIEAKLFLNGEIDLRGTILVPYKKTDAYRVELAKQLKNAILKEIKSTTGAGKKEVTISFDSLGIHPTDKFRFILWDLADQEEEESITYEVKQDIIIPPLLPTYRQSYGLTHQVDSQRVDFIHFWTNLMLNHKMGNPIELLVESSLSSTRTDFETGQDEFARANGEEIMGWLKQRFKNETGDDLKITLKSFTRGPRFPLLNDTEMIDDSVFNYFTLIPLVNTRKDLIAATPQPYMVNFDYFFNGIDTGAWGFQRFAAALALMVLRDGYVELRIESGISKIPIERNQSNLYVAYKHLLVSQNRLKKTLEAKLIDPNRILFVDEAVVEQGPIYDGSVPIINYRKYHYLRIIPEKLLQN